MAEDQIIWDAFTREIENQRLELAEITRGARALTPIERQPPFSTRDRRRAALRLIEKRPPLPYELPTCNNPQY
jgi:hypothetical protein